MPAGKFKIYDKAKKWLTDGTIDLDDTTNWKFALFQSTSNANTLTLASPILANLTNQVANGNGYVTDGVAVTGVTLNEVSGVVTFDCDDVSFNAVGGSITARLGVLFKNATVNGIVKPAVCVCLLDSTPADVTATAGNPLNITMPATGLFSYSGANVD